MTEKDQTDRLQEGVPPFSSNVERLSMGEWLVLFLGLLILGTLAGPTWGRLEVFEPSPAYRIPYQLSEDYWLFKRLCEKAGDSGMSFVIGDSFVWGQYVEKDQSLSSFLNQYAGSERFVNAGLDGTHPLALEGLIKHHCKALRDKPVVLHLNLLWMSSPQADLQLERGLEFNHSRLVPQFTPAVPSYRAPTSERLGVVLARYVPVLDWSRHIQAAYFSNSDLPRWTLDHPYLNPLRQIDLSPPDSPEDPHPSAKPWNIEGTANQAPPWVDLETSQQWQAFQRLVVNLEDRGNSVFVLVGPLNEHMLEASNREMYKETLVQVEVWLKRHGVPYQAPSTLPSVLYADMSHPFGEGYAIIARDLWEEIRP